MASKRIIKELRQMERDQPFNIMIDSINDDNVFHWHGVIIGPLDTPYENGIFHFEIDFPPDYPFRPPKIKFLTEIFHPNVSPNGFICMDILQENWSASVIMPNVLLSFVSLLYDPDLITPSNHEAAHYFRSDREKYNQLVRQWTQIHAICSTVEKKIVTAKEAITQQLNDIETNHSSNINIRPYDMRDLFHWQGTITGPHNSPYQDRRFTINIQFPLNYPEKPPSIAFLSYIVHPNISDIDGSVNNENLKTKWTPRITISKILQDLFYITS